VPAAVWEIAIWVSRGRSWYFDTSYVLVTTPGWLKVAFAAAVLTVASVTLSRLTLLGAVLVIGALMALIVSILASPVVRLHAWIPSWGASATVVVVALICVALTSWRGVEYADRYHSVGHDGWCVAESR
jgi:hypothetical protein